jgi:hypothetical protein
MAVRMPSRKHPYRGKANGAQSPASLALKIGPGTIRPARLKVLSYRKYARKNLICSWDFFRGLDNQHLDRAFSRFQFEAELILEED